MEFTVGKKGARLVPSGKRFRRVLARRAPTGREYAYTRATESRYKSRTMTDLAF